MSVPLVVSVGMTHPQNIAGLGLDIRVAADYGVRHAMVIAAVSAQDDRGVQRVYPLPREIVLEQIRAAQMRDAAAVRVGALGSAANIELLQSCLGDRRVVIDPVLRSSAGGSLYAQDPPPVLGGLRGGWTAITPNIEEAERLTGIGIAGVDDMVAAGKLLVSSGADAALVKGGHLPGEPVDALVMQERVEIFRDTRIAGKLRGTGCRLAMALACELALGRDLTDAVRGAREYVRANLARS